MHFIKLRYLRDRIILNDTNFNHNLKNYKKILKEAKRFSKSKNSKLIFIFLPEFERYNYPYRQRDKNYKFMINLVKDLKIPIINLHEELFAKQPNPNIFFPFEMNGHYNKTGYREAAIVIKKFMNKIEIEK